MRKVALITNDASYLLDHLAPLADIFDMPLIVTDNKTLDLAKAYYPQVKTTFMSHDRLSFDFLAANFDIIFESHYFSFAQYKDIFLKEYKKRMRFVFCPHGNSDKGHTAPFLQAFSYQDIILLYGQQMVATLKKEGILKKIKTYLITGNYRLSYYWKYKSFYDKKIKEEIFSKLDPNKKTILYAPTWNDAEKSTSFFKVTKNLIEQLPSRYNLIIKAHPFLQQKEPALFYSALPPTIGKNILLLIDYPPVFPILSRCDIYLGDASSVGYDFLVFKRPMFFFKPFDKKLPLQNCGIIIPEREYPNIYNFVIKNLNKNFSKKQEKLFKYTYI